MTTTAVKDISFDVGRGEIVAIVGESGSGKSITALSVLQLLPPQRLCSGDIFFSPDDLQPIDLMHLPVSQMNTIRGREIAMIFQEPMTSLNPVFTCGQQVIEAILLHQPVSREQARQQTIGLFESVLLPEPAAMMNRYPHQLSGGQKQRVMIAMAMSCNPALLIADEPTTALDVTVQKTILELIKALQQRNNMSVIFITHDLSVVADIADRIVVMYKGGIAEQGSTADILRAPQHPYTRALLACRPANHPKGQRLPVVSDFMGPEITAIAKKYTPAEPQTDTGDNTASPVILAVNNLTVSYPVKKNLFGRAREYFHAVNDVSFTVKKGETLGLVGESGCGKTTLGRAILQLTEITSGKILLEGKDITSIKPAAFRHMRKDLQIVFQDPYGSLNPRISIGNAILEPLKVHALYQHDRERKERVMAMLEKVSLQPDHYNRYPHQFSGGQRQRICIARALSLNPAFLVFDESVSALDVSVQAQVLNLLDDLKKEFNFSAIFISHDLSVVHHICNRILVMYKGKIVEEGEASQIYFDPQHAYTQKLIEAIPGKKASRFI